MHRNIVVHNTKPNRALRTPLGLHHGRLHIHITHLETDLITKQVSSQDSQPFSHSHLIQTEQT